MFHSLSPVKRRRRPHRGKEEKDLVQAIFRTPWPLAGGPTCRSDYLGFFSRPGAIAEQLTEPDGDGRGNRFALVLARDPQQAAISLLVLPVAWITSSRSKFAWVRRGFRDAERPIGGFRRWRLARQFRVPALPPLWTRSDWHKAANSNRGEARFVPHGRGPARFLGRYWPERSRGWF